MATIGVLGAGQLGKMLGLAGIAMDCKLRFYDSSPEAPARHVGELIIGEFTDSDKLKQFAVGLSVVTYEFENVPFEAAKCVSESVRIVPGLRALEISQVRSEEKRFFEELGITTAKFACVQSGSVLEQTQGIANAVRIVGLPCVLKTTRLGYDGKGQHIIRTPADATAALSMLAGAEGIVEEFINFSRELSIVAVRSKHGEMRCYPLVENIHHQGILRTTSVPARDVSDAIQRIAEAAITKVLERLSYVGVLALELFQRGNELLVNEMAPRVHNSGHWTIEGAETSQFENHLRAVLDFPLGSTALRGCSLMVNLIGYLPEPAAVLGIPGAHLHLYGKEVKPGRKVGHVTLNAKNETQLRRAEERLRGAFEKDGYLF